MMALAGLTYNVLNPDRRRVLQRRLSSARQHAPVPRRQGRASTGRCPCQMRSQSPATCIFTASRPLWASTASPPLPSNSAIGSLTGIDISGEKPGLLPTPDWKKQAFKRPEDQIWFPGETVNFGVGQGYLLVTPLQLAHVAASSPGAATIFSRGWSWECATPRAESSAMCPCPRPAPRASPMRAGPGPQGHDRRRHLRHRRGNQQGRALHHCR